VYTKKEMERGMGIGKREMKELGSDLKHREQRLKKISIHLTPS
jgi:hypothetical protein